jgi:hypothetical protein
MTEGLSGNKEQSDHNRFELAWSGEVPDEIARGLPCKDNPIPLH